MRSHSYIFLLVVLILGGLAGFGYSRLQFRKGLDIQGGVRLTYQMVLSELSPEQKATPATIQSKLVSILQSRAVGPLGVTEPVISGKGDDQIIVELPGFSDVREAEEVMGSSAKMKLYWAKNVITSKNSNRPYTIVDTKSAKDIGVNFAQKFGGSGDITPSNPQYKQIIEGWELILAGDDLKSAQPANENGTYVPSMNFSPKGAEALRKFTGEHINQGENIAFVLDGRVLSIAPVRDGQVLSDNAQIEGTFPDGYVVKLCDMLNSGALPITLNLMASQNLDPTLGSAAFDKMVLAGEIAFAVIALFLIGYYAFPGFVALLALLLYILFTLTVLKLINATFSLAGIAGFILSVGMAVDANILVFERFKEEMKSGKTLAKSIDLGFRRALTAIIDSNACTVITSLVLVQLGTGPVKGFATTLIIGVMISLFTAVTVTRSLLMFFVGSGLVTNPKWYAINRNWFGKRFDADTSQPLQVVNKAGRWFAISALTIVICIPFLAMKGIRLNVELQGGTQVSYAMKDTAVTSDQILSNLEKAGLLGGNVQFSTDRAGAGGARHVDISLPPQPGIDSGPDQIKKIATAAGIPNDPHAQFQTIGPQLQAETVRNAGIGVVLSSLLIIVYLAVRFGTGFGGFVAGLRFGVSAIGALVHDILVVFGTAAVVGYLLHWEISALFLTAMLTIIGFSVHDTIVIFDRIRENLRRSKKTEDFGDLMNRSITQSFARSINTSGTVVVTLLILVIFGTVTNELKFFVTSMLIGILSGTFSSIYNASPILYLWDKAIVRKKGPEQSLIGMVAADAARNRVLTTAAATTPTEVTTAPDGRTYGQVRRRANQPTKKGIELDD